MGFVRNGEGSDGESALDIGHFEMEWEVVKGACIVMDINSILVNDQGKEYDKNGNVMKCELE